MSDQSIVSSSSAALRSARGAAARGRNARRVAGNVKLVIMIPPDVRKWLENRATYFGATISSEVSRCCRARMEEEAGTTPPADAAK
ncbi:hypothetical protein HAP41_0000002045 [Bradyrhizobium barranii subsp. apii]|uniref:Uncharacterized protein n=1 Tax=Bradyrhizobium barranii subsp. apii TaxID=2819348 RepID=A0A8T5UUA1_9BRAD|nr:hypothetical protein [Bradyrhizobium barranii]UPT87964.1 hypothetical protein HAP41_0000002045 [Bradyrhizobium barranii subsp. apii]